MRPDVPVPWHRADFCCLIPPLVVHHYLNDCSVISNQGQEGKSLESDVIFCNTDGK